MRRTSELPLLLAPAGGEAAFLAAVAAGADAVYLGGGDFNARAYAENFDDETLARCVKTAHAHGVAVHVTMNTLLTDRELQAAVTWAARLWEMGVDALICADLGLVALLRKHLPDFPVHASTQVSLHSTAGVEEVSDLGFTVAVAARELSRENLQSMVANASAVIEGFVHGALCVSYSGQCLFSSLVGGRSGNRGACAQPCRLPFANGYALSLKDLSLASHIPALIGDGVGCLKIEGRMKSPAYVWGVTKIYRRLLDENRAATQEETEELAAIFSREGHTDGYYTKQLAHMTGIRREEDKADSRKREEGVIPAPAPVRLTATCRLVAGEPARLTLTTPQGKTVTVEGEIPNAARSAPMTREGVAERLCKLGGTPFALSCEDVELTLGEGLNLAPAALNALRRAAVEALTASARIPVGVEMLPQETVRFHGPATTALFLRGAVWDAISADAKELIDVAYVPLWEYAGLRHPPAGVWFPPVIPDDEETAVLKQLEQAKARGATHALCGNPAQVRYAREAGLAVLGDFRLNITNRHAAAYWAKHGAEDVVLSPELTAPQMRDIGGRAIVYGRIPLMLTERCYASADGTCNGCGEACDHAELTDRRGVKFPVMRVPEHRNLILNSLPTYMGDHRALIPQGVRAHLIFSCENEARCEEVLMAWKAGLPLNEPVRRFTKPQGEKSGEVPKKQGTTPINKHYRKESAKGAGPAGKRYPARNKYKHK